MWFLTLVLRNHYLFFLLLVLFFFFKVPSKIEMHYTRVNTVPSHQWCVASYHKKYTFCKTSFFCKLLIFLFFLISPVKRLMHGLTSIVVEYFSCVISFFFHLTEIFDMAQRSQACLCVLPCKCQHLRARNQNAVGCKSF